MDTFCSIAGDETLAHARVLTTALRRHHPDARTTVLVLGGESDADREPFELLTPSDLGSAVVDLALRGGDGSAARMAPFLLRHVLRQGAEVAVFLGPETYVYDSLKPVVELARRSGIALARRAHRLPDDGKRPTYGDLLVAGRIASNLVAVSTGRDSEQFLDWWRQRVQEEDGASARWLELAPDLFPSVALIDDPGCNVSFWNLHARPLAGDGQLTAGGSRLRFADFTGLRPDRPYWLGDTSTRVQVIDDPLLADLCGKYCEEVREAGWRPPRNFEENERLGNGMRFDPLLRTLWGEADDAGRSFGDPQSPVAADEFATWVREPVGNGRSTRVNRYLLAAYRSRSDLRDAFPDPDGADADGLIAWAWEQGRRELQLVSELLPAPPEGAELAQDPHLAVNLFGFLDDTLGIAEAARLYITALRAAGVPVTTTAIEPDLPVEASVRKRIRRYGSRRHKGLRCAFEPTINFVCVNGDHIDALVRARGREELLGGRPTIGQWAWETDVLPPSWLPGFQYLDEIWVNSNYVAHNLGRLSPIPVVVIPQAMVVPAIANVPLDIARDSRFTFLFLLDFFSTLQRKNPLGVVDAFARAFTPGEGPRLLLKTINGRFRPDAQAELREHVGEHPDIEIIDRYLEPAENAALLARADCYVSLHRSEGFGLTLAESMALGTPVIATGYSGNMDFTTAHNSYLVDWRPARVGPGNDVYPPEGTWAEPDIDHAAELMRRVWEQPDEGRAKAQRARLDIERLYAPANVGRVARARLERLVERRAGISPHASAPGIASQTASGLAAVERELALDVRRGAPPFPQGLKGIARRLVLRVMLPFTVHERSLDRSMVDALRGVHTMLKREQSLRLQDRARLSRVEERVSRLEDR